MNLRMKMLIFTLILSLVLVPLHTIILNGDTGSQPRLVVEYDFINRLSDNQGNSVLTTFSSENDGYNHNNASSSFGLDNYGNYWTWTSTLARGGGFSIDIDEDLSQSYSIGVRFSFDSTGPSWKKIIDYKNQSSDNGFYFYSGGKLQFYPYSPLGLSTTADGQIVDIIASRSAEGIFKAYTVIDGTLVQEIELEDTSGQAIPSVIDGKTRFGFFFDDTATSSEASNGGKVYSLKVWDQPIESLTLESALNVSQTDQIENFESGVRLEWPDVSEFGYLIYRSLSEEELGEPLTDFYIETNTFMDVNVQPDTLYYYTVFPVLYASMNLQNAQYKAAPPSPNNPALGAAISRQSVRTNTTVKPSSTLKDFISLSINDPYMSVNGRRKEIDPGRNTAPKILQSRTMVPIRAIIENMGGSIAWDPSERSVTIQARSHTIKMWIDTTSIQIDGILSTMDVAPVIDGNRTYVPVRFASENLEAKVDWINNHQEVVISYSR